MPAVPSMTTNRPPPLLAASARARSAATWTSRSSSKLVPPQGTTLAVAITTNPESPQHHSLGARLGLAPTRVAPVPAHPLGRDDRVFAPLTTLRYRVHGDVCGAGRVLVLPVTPEITASFVAAAEAAPAPPAALPRRVRPAGRRA